jgi:nanoRNase/pAp phosphatase (c-di-AMP/oligoRNAs hydrolase)
MSKSSCAIQCHTLTSNCPALGDVRVTPAVDPSYHAVFVIECSDITRPGLADLEKQFVVNIDHHSTTALFGKHQLDRFNCFGSR